jgi:hypothetical protein
MPFKNSERNILGSLLIKSKSIGIAVLNDLLESPHPQPLSLGRGESGIIENDLGSLYSSKKFNEIQLKVISLLRSSSY